MFLEIDPYQNLVFKIIFSNFGSRMQHLPKSLVVAYATTFPILIDHFSRELDSRTVEKLTTFAYQKFKIFRAYYISVEDQEGQMNRLKIIDSTDS